MIDKIETIFLLWNLYSNIRIQTVRNKYRNNVIWKKNRTEKGMETEGDVILDKMIRNETLWGDDIWDEIWMKVVSKADIWGNSF